MGPGIVHHVAWQVADDAAQDRMRKRLQAAGMRVTPVIDRNYFHSIYFPSPGRILFEVATNGPGFLIDEDMDALGAHLKLPAWLEGQRSILENTLPELTFPDRKRE
jgi:glyoxalase family protein